MMNRQGFDTSFFRNMNEQLTDRIETLCTECNAGWYLEASIHDDLEGKLHCENCYHEVDRYVIVSEANVTVVDEFQYLVMRAYR